MRKAGPVSIANAYALIALVFGLFFIVATPPFGTGDEPAHFERSYEIATGGFLGAEGVPAGMQAFIDDAFAKVKSGEAARDGDFRRWRNIKLAPNEIEPYPEPLRKVLRLHSPLCYAHFAPVMAAGLALGLSPFALFYALRLVALLVGVALVWFSIRRVPPTLRPIMAYAALLPTAVVYFAAVNIESLLVGLGFLYFALVVAHAANADRKLAPRDIIVLAALALLLGQFKTGYLLLPLFALILPASKFSGSRTRFAALAVICLPGMVASLAWALIVKDAMLGDIVYSTMNGNRVEPSAQLAGVLADPVGYAATVLRTLFASNAPDFAWRTFLGVAGWTNIPVAAPVYAALTAGLFLVWMSGAPAPGVLTTRPAVAIQLLVFAATGFAVLTLVYFQWNGVGERVIEGFQGRYLFAAAPLLFALPPTRLSMLADDQRRSALAFAIALVGLVAMAIAVVDRYQ